MKALTQSEYLYLKGKLDRRSAWLKDNPKIVGWAMPVDCQITNEGISRVEQYEFMHNKPSDVFAYHSSYGEFTTWNGVRLGAIIRIYPEYRNNFGARINRVITLGDNGIFYYGTSLGKNMYMRLHQYKHQKALQVEFKQYWYRWLTDHDTDLSLRSASFCIDDSGVSFRGYTQDHRWNGWACPLFTKEVAESVLLIHCYTDSQGNRAGFTYDPVSDCFIVPNPDYPDEESETYKGESFRIGGAQVKLYGIGAYNWVWDESQPEQV